MLLGGAQGVDEEAARLAEARAHLDAGRFEEAKEAFREGESGRGEEARAVFGQNLAIRQRLSGAAEVPYSRVSLGDYFRHIGATAEVRAQIDEALAAVGRAWPPDHPEVEALRDLTGTASP